MNPDKWSEIKEKILSTFQVLNQEVLENTDEHEVKEIIEFEGPLGKIKLEWLKKPKLLDKKTQYSNRIGGNVSIDYIFSEDEFTYAMIAYKWDVNLEDWQQLTGGDFVNF